MMTVRITLPERALAHASSSDDAARPALQGGWVHSSDGKTFTLIVSDSYQLAALPVEVGGTEARILEITEKPLFVPASALKDAGPGGEVVLKEDGLIEMYGRERKARGRRTIEHLYRMPTGIGKPPNYTNILAANTPPAGARTLQFGINAELLYKLARTLGATKRGVKFTLNLTDVKIGSGANTYQKPLFVEGLHDNDRSGLLMPVRIEI